MIPWLASAALAGWTDVSVAEDAACGVHDSALVCWGRLTELQLEPGHHATVRPPTRIPLEDVERVVVSNGHGCVIHGTGELRCFGSNGDGQVGPGPSSVLPAEAPVVLPEVVDVAMTSSDTCAVTRSGEVRCWGWGRDGLDTAVPRLPPAVEVAIESGTTCAVDRRDQVWCWGGNPGGVLGIPTEEANAAAWPLQVPGVRGRGLTLGSGWACIGEGADRQCWGDDAWRQEVEAAIRPVPVPAARLVSRGPASCAIDDDDVLWCWGENEDGGLGTVVPLQRTTPAPVRDLDDAIALAVAGNTACATRRSGEVVCWGDGRYGPVPGGQRAATPTPVPGLRGVRSLDAHGAVACAITGDGVSCWGQGSSWLGGGVAYDEQLETPRVVWGDPPADEVVLGDGLLCVQDDGGARCRIEDGGELPAGDDVRHDGRVSGSAWLRCVAGRRGVSCGGLGDRGQSGQGVRADHVPLGTVRDLGAVDDLAVGRQLVCALEQHQPRCWGEGALVPLRFEAELRGTDIDVNNYLACLATDAGGVSCIGPEAYWMDEPTTWTEVPGLSDVVEVGVGDDFVCARHDHGGVSCWGSTQHGRLGDGTATWSDVPVQVQAP